MTKGHEEGVGCAHCPDRGDGFTGICVLELTKLCTSYVGVDCTSALLQLKGLSELFMGWIRK